MSTRQDIARQEIERDRVVPGRVTSSKHTYLLVGVMAVLVTATMGFALHECMRMAETNMRLLDAVTTVKLDFHDLHIAFDDSLFEEHAFDRTDLQGRLDSLTAHTRSMLAIEQDINSLVIPAAGPRVHHGIKRLLSNIETLRDAAEEAESSVGDRASRSASNKRFEALFADISLDADMVESSLRQQIPVGIQRYRVFQGIVIAIGLGLAVLVAIILLHFERRRTQDLRALQDSEQRFYELFERAPLAYQSLDTEGRFITVNQAWLEMLGYAKGEVLGRWFGDFMAPASREKFRRAFPKATKVGRVRGVEFELIHRDGTRRIISLNGNVGHDRDGRFTQTHCILADVTETKRAEEALKNSEARYYDLYANAPFMYCSVDAETGIVRECNQTLAKATGYPANEIVGKSVFTVYHPDSREHARRVFKRFLASGTVENEELHLLRKDGSSFPVSLTATAVRDPDGRIVYSRSILYDLTERKRMEDALRANEEKYRQLFTAESDAIILFDAEAARIIDINDAACALYGYDRPAFLKLTVMDLSAEVEETVKALARINSGDMSKIGLRHHRKRDGTVFPVEISSGSFTLDGRRVLCGIVRDITERRQAEQALRESEERYRGIFAESVAAIFIFDKDKNFVDANRAGLELLGYSRDELLQMSIGDVDVDPTVVRPAQEDLLSGRRIANYEHQLRKKDGTVITVLNNSRPLTDADGNVVGLLSTLVDITERKRVSKALAESEERYRILTEASPNAIVVHARGVILYVNAETVRLLGAKSPEELAGRPVLDFVHPDYRELASTRMNQVYSKQGPAPTIEERFVRLDGEVIDVDVAAVEVDFDGNPASLVVFRDITERKHALKALRESEEKFRRIAERAFDVIVMYDLDGTFAYVSPSVSRVFGFASSELTGRKLADVTPPEMRWKIRGFFERVRQGVIIDNYVTKGIKKDGTIATIQINAVPVYEDNRVVGVQCIVRDISEIRRLQEREERAQRLETAGQIAGQVAHDFNNLLSPLTVYPDFIREKLPDNHPVLKYLRDIEVSAKRIAEINQQLLTLGRRGHYNQKPLNLNDVVTEAVRELQPLPTTIVCETNLAEDLMCIQGGHAQLRRVLSNLFQNARDAVGDIGQIAIRTENFYVEPGTVAGGQVPTGEYVKLTVTDTGQGISAEDLPRVFEPFFTTKKADKKRGSGLGLSVVHAVVKDHNGYIDVSSALGRGTSFYLYFPITREAIDDSKSEQIVGGTERVLIVDDDDMQRKVSLELLKHLGYEAHTVNSGEAAIAFLNDNRAPDLLLLDMVMPGGIDGTETYRRALEINPRQKAVIVSGFAESERVQAARELGAGTFIQKPVTRRVIALAVRKELDRMGTPAKPPQA